MSPFTNNMLDEGIAKLQDPSLGSVRTLGVAEVGRRLAVAIAAQEFEAFLREAYSPVLLASILKTVKQGWDEIAAQQEEEGQEEEEEQQEKKKKTNRRKSD